MTLKVLIDNFQQDLNVPGSILLVIKETILIVKEEHNTEMNTSIGIICTLFSK